MSEPELRNVALIAHVDHGKTTLVDELLRQSGQFRAGGDDTPALALDTNPLERERGITILAKNCAIDYTARDGRHGRINVVDTPGHADFSGEVERVLKLADGALLLVDAAEGVMPQTRFVLGKALDLGLVPVVVLNKMDRPDARPAAVVEQVFDLLVNLGAEERALDFPVIYASSRDGWASWDPEKRGEGIHDLFDALFANVPSPGGEPDGPLQLLVTTLDYSDYVGRIGIGRVFAGAVEAGERVAVIDRGGGRRSARVGGLLRFDGLGRAAAKRVGTGDLCAVTGVEEIAVGDTLTSPADPRGMPPVPVDEPTLTMTFGINDGPFGGREGTYVTARQIGARLRRQGESDVALDVREQQDRFVVAGRGLLHLGVLLEQMRREGYELTVGKPEVVRREENGAWLEPVEDLAVEVPDDSVGAVMQEIGERRGEVADMVAEGGTTRLRATIPSRGLIGLNNRLLAATAGAAVVNHTFRSFEPDRGPIPGRGHGTLVASEGGSVTAYALHQLADRGTMFVEPGDEVYAGQIVGAPNAEGDLTVNVTKQKKLTNVRAAAKDTTVVLKSPSPVTLEGALEFVAEDELVEVTPAAVRLRKIRLSEGERRRARRA